MDLVVPGPVLADETVFDLHVTWASLPTHSTCPASFDSLAHTPRLVDCGVNLFDPAFKSDLPQVVERALQAGVVQMMLISTTPADSLFNCRTLEKHPHEPHIMHTNKQTNNTATSPCSYKTLLLNDRIGCLA